jgi:hypothetical protein
MLIVTFMSGLAWAQTGEITGRVTDPSGAIVPGAEVAIKNVDTGVSRAVKSNESGYYSAPLLPIGNYEVSVSRSGFRSLTRTGVRLEVQQVARLDFVLEVGSLAESVTVAGAAPLVATEEASLATTVDHRKIQQLPLNGRNPFTLVNLVPGVVSERSNTFGRRANVNGARDATTELLIDGGATNSTDQGDLKATPPLEGVEEFKVQTASFSPETGHSAAVINVVTRGGSNDFSQR